RRLAREAVGERVKAARSREPLWRRLWGHPWRAATLSFLVLPDRTFVARGSWMSLDLGVCALSRLKVRELVARLHRAMARRAEAEVLDALGAELADGLQLPRLLASLPRRIRRLVLVADDALHGFPFAALRSQGHYLCERYALTMAF